MSDNKFKPSNVVVFMPKGYECMMGDKKVIDSQILIDSLPERCSIPPAAGAAPRTAGVITVHFFEYKSVATLIPYITKEEAMIIVNTSVLASTDLAPVNEVEYVDKLNDLFGVRPYTILSTSCLHQIRTEQTPNDHRTRMIREHSSRAHTVIAENLVKWFNDDSRTLWSVNSAYKHLASKCVVIEQM